jgi:hypothetical protein
MDEKNYMLALRFKLQKPYFFLKIEYTYIQIHMENLLVNFGKQIYMHNSYYIHMQ